MPLDSVPMKLGGGALPDVLERGAADAAGLLAGPAWLEEHFLLLWNIVWWMPLACEIGLRPVTLMSLYFLRMILSVTLCTPAATLGHPASQLLL